MSGDKEIGICTCYLEPDLEQPGPGTQSCKYCVQLSHLIIFNVHALSSQQVNISESVWIWTGEFISVSGFLLSWVIFLGATYPFP